MTVGEWGEEMVIGALELRKRLWKECEITLMEMPIDELLQLKLLYDYLKKIENGGGE